MKVTESELIVTIDVDKTLIMPQKVDSTTDTSNLIKFDYAGEVLYMKPHKLHVDLVKHYKTRGYYNIIWSANGYEWALQAVKKLGLEDYVDEVKSKPIKYVDDMPCENWMGSHVYIPFSEDV